MSCLVVTFLLWVCTQGPSTHVTDQPLARTGCWLKYSVLDQWDPMGSRVPARAGMEEPREHGAMGQENVETVPVEEMGVRKGIESIFPSVSSSSSLPDQSANVHTL